MKGKKSDPMDSWGRVPEWADRLRGTPCGSRSTAGRSDSVWMTAQGATWVPRRVAAPPAGFRHNQCTDVEARAMGAGIVDALANGEEVRIAGFGALGTGRRQARTGRYRE